MKMPFGKHEGKEIEEIPSDYLQWLLDEGWLGSKYGIEVEEEVEDVMANRDIPGHPTGHWHEYEEEGF